MDKSNDDNDLKTFIRNLDSKKPVLILMNCDKCSRRDRLKVTRVLNTEDFLILAKRFHQVRLNKQSGKHAHIIVADKDAKHIVRLRAEKSNRVAYAMKRVLGNKNRLSLPRVKRIISKIDQLFNKETMLQTRAKNMELSDRNMDDSKIRKELRDIRAEKSKGLELLIKVLKGDKDSNAREVKRDRRGKGSPRGRERMRKTPITKGMWREYYTFKSNVFHV